MISKLAYVCSVEAGEACLSLDNYVHYESVDCRSLCFEQSNVRTDLMNSFKQYIKID